jgi:hypothetical protein
MQRLGLTLAMVALGLAGAQAAELPTRQAKAQAPAAKACQINGKPGFLAGDGQTCIRLSGYISGQVSAGNLK